MCNISNTNMCQTENVYPKDSPIPNWPKPESLKQEYFSTYCTPVRDAITDWLKATQKEDDFQTRLKWYSIYNVFHSSNKSELTPEEFNFLVEAYENQVELILMKSWYYD